MNVVRPDLEELFSDPQTDGPFSYARIVDDDDARVLSPFAESVLDAWGAGAEFVPQALGGRWSSTPQLVERLRPIFRRDPSVGLGYGLTTLMAAVNVWTAGDETQRAAVAAHLLAGERIAVGFHELAHGNDLLNNECRATYDDGAWRVSGGKQIVNNIDRAESVLLMVSTRPDAIAARRYSLLLWRKDAVNRGAADTRRRVLTAGMRGCWIGVADLNALPIGADQMIGADGSAAETALKAFQVTRAVIPALAVGTVEAALRESLAYAADRALYGASVLDIPHARSLYATALADTLLADAFSSAVVRALHLAPRECFVLTAASKYLAPMLLNDAMQQLSVLAGSTFYARVAPYAILEKFVRDLTVVPIGHAGSTSCLSTMLPMLPIWARRARKTTDADLAVTDLAALSGVAPIDFSALGLGPGGRDVLAAALHDPRVRAALALDAPHLLALVSALAESFADDLEAAETLGSHEVATAAPAHAFDLAARIALHLAAGAVLGAWMNARGHGAPSALGDTALVEAALTRAAERLGVALATTAVLRGGVVDALVDHGRRCAAEGVSVGVVPVRLADRVGAEEPVPAFAGDREETR